MENIIVREYVTGNIKHNVFTLEKYEAAYDERSRRWYSLALGAKRSITKIRLKPLYRLDSYVLDDVSSAAVRMLYGEVTHIIYKYYFRKPTRLRMPDPEHSVYVIKKRWETNRAYVIDEYMETTNADLRRRTIILKLKNHD